MGEKTEENRYEGIGARIREIRKKTGMSAAALATAAGYKDRKSITKIESGITPVTADRLSAIADALGVGMNTLLGPEFCGKGPEAKAPAYRKKDDILRDYIEWAGRAEELSKAFGCALDEMESLRKLMKAQDSPFMDAMVSRVNKAHPGLETGRKWVLMERLREKTAAREKAVRIAG